VPYRLPTAGHVFNGMIAESSMVLYNPPSSMVLPRPPPSTATRTAMQPPPRAFGRLKAKVQAVFTQMGHLDAGLLPSIAPRPSHRKTTGVGAIGKTGLASAEVLSLELFY
jgi:hypothetical protein